MSNTTIKRVKIPLSKINGCNISPVRNHISQERELMNIDTVGTLQGIDTSAVKDLVLKLDELAPNRLHNALLMGWRSSDDGIPLRNPYSMCVDIVHLLSAYFPKNLITGSAKKKVYSLIEPLFPSQKNKRLLKRRFLHDIDPETGDMNGLIWKDIGKLLKSGIYARYEVRSDRLVDFLSIDMISEFYMDKIFADDERLIEKSDDGHWRTVETSDGMSSKVCDYQRLTVLLASFDVLGDCELNTNPINSKIPEMFRTMTPEMLQKINKLKFLFSEMSHSSLH